MTGYLLLKIFRYCSALVTNSKAYLVISCTGRAKKVIPQEKFDIAGIVDL